MHFSPKKKKKNLNKIQEWFENILMFNERVMYWSARKGYSKTMRATGNKLKRCRFNLDTFQCGGAAVRPLCTSLSQESRQSWGGSKATTDRRVWLLSQISKGNTREKTLFLLVLTISLWSKFITEAPTQCGAKCWAWSRLPLFSHQGNRG